MSGVSLGCIQGLPDRFRTRRPVRPAYVAFSCGDSHSISQNVYMFAPVHQMGWKGVLECMIWAGWNTDNCFSETQRKGRMDLNPILGEVYCTFDLTLRNSSPLLPMYTDLKCDMVPHAATSSYLSLESFQWDCVCIGQSVIHVSKISC